MLRISCRVGRIKNICKVVDHIHDCMAKGVVSDILVSEQLMSDSLNEALVFLKGVLITYGIENNKTQKLELTSISRENIFTIGSQCLLRTDNCLPEFNNIHVFAQLLSKIAAVKLYLERKFKLDCIHRNDQRGSHKLIKNCKFSDNCYINWDNALLEQAIQNIFERILLANLRGSISLLQLVIHDIMENNLSSKVERKDITYLTIQIDKSFYEDLLKNICINAINKPIEQFIQQVINMNEELYKKILIIKQPNGVDRLVEFQKEKFDFAASDDVQCDCSSALRLLFNFNSYEPSFHKSYSSGSFIEGASSISSNSSSDISEEEVTSGSYSEEAKSSEDSVASVWVGNTLHC